MAARRSRHAKGLSGMWLQIKPVRVWRTLMRHKDRVDRACNLFNW